MGRNRDRRGPPRNPEWPQVLGATKTTSGDCLSLHVRIEFHPAAGVEEGVSGEKVGCSLSRCRYDQTNSRALAGQRTDRPVCGAAGRKKGSRLFAACDGGPPPK